MTANVGSSAVITGVETVNFNTAIASGTTFTVAADKISGANTLNITRGDLLDGSISGKGAVTVTALNGTKVKALNVVGNGTGAVTVTEATAGGVVLTADGSGGVTLNGTHPHPELVVK